MTALDRIGRAADAGNHSEPDTLDLTAIVGDLSVFENETLHRTSHVRTLGVGPVGRLLSLDDVDYLLSATGLRTPFVSLVRNDEIVPDDQYCRRIRLGSTSVPDLVHPGRVLGQVRSGATLILQGMQRYWPPLARLCRQVEAHWGFACHANAYLTPPAAQGFAEHDDSHDTLIIQTHGAKQWTVAQQPTGDATDLREHDGRWTFTLGHPAALYIPAGIRHAAFTAGQASLHVTIGMTPWTWDRVARTAIEMALAALDLSARLPTGGLAGRTDLSSGVKDLTTRLADSLRNLAPDTVANALVAEFIDKAPPLLSGQLQEALDGLELADSSCVTRRPGTLATVVTTGDGVVLVLGDRRVPFPAASEPVLRQVLALPHFHVSELARYLTAGERIRLTEQLIHEGLLVLARE